MVTNFEEYTHPLTADELVMFDLFVALVKHRTKKTAIKSGETEAFPLCACARSIGGKAGLCEKNKKTYVKIQMPKRCI